MTTARAPPAVPAGIVTVTLELLVVWFARVRAPPLAVIVAVTPSTVTEEVARRPLPVKVTEVPPALVPFIGVLLETVGVPGETDFETGWVPSGSPKRKVPFHAIAVKVALLSAPEPPIESKWGIHVAPLSRVETTKLFPEMGDAPSTKAVPAHVTLLQAAVG